MPADSSSSAEQVLRSGGETDASMGRGDRVEQKTNHTDEMDADEEGQESDEKDEEEEEEEEEEDGSMGPASEDSDGTEDSRAATEALIALLHPAASEPEQETAWCPIRVASAKVGIDPGYISTWASLQMVCSIKPPGRNRHRLVSPCEIRRFMLQHMNKRHRKRILRFIHRDTRASQQKDSVQLPPSLSPVEVEPPLIRATNRSDADPATHTAVVLTGSENVAATAAETSRLEQLPSAGAWLNV